MRRITQGARDERGQALTELVFVIPIFLLILFGLIDFAKAFNYWIDATHLANTGARYAAVNRVPGCTTNATTLCAPTLQQVVANQANTKELRDGTTVSTPNRLCTQVTFYRGTTAITFAQADVGDAVKVVVKSTEHQFTLITKFLPFFKVNLSGSASMRLEQKPGRYTSGSLNSAGAAC